MPQQAGHDRHICLVRKEQAGVGVEKRMDIEFSGRSVYLQNQVESPYERTEISQTIDVFLPKFDHNSTVLGSILAPIYKF